MSSRLNDYELLSNLVEAGLTLRAMYPIVGCGPYGLLKQLKKFGLVPPETTWDDMKHPTWGQGKRKVLRVFPYEDFKKNLEAGENRISFYDLYNKCCEIEPLVFYHFNNVYYGIYYPRYKQEKAASSL